MGQLVLLHPGSSEDEDTKAANIARMSAEAKKKGNEVGRRTLTPLTHS
jgi:hypothetical protein